MFLVLAPDDAWRKSDGDVTSWRLLITLCPVTGSLSTEKKFVSICIYVYVYQQFISLMKFSINLGCILKTTNTTILQQLTGFNRHSGFLLLAWHQSCKKTYTQGAISKTRPNPTCDLVFVMSFKKKWEFLLGKAQGMCCRAREARRFFSAGRKCFNQSCSFVRHCAYHNANT